MRWGSNSSLFQAQGLKYLKFYSNCVTIDLVPSLGAPLTQWRNHFIWLVSINAGKEKLTQGVKKGKKLLFSSQLTTFTPGFQPLLVSWVVVT